MASAAHLIFGTEPLGPPANTTGTSLRDRRARLARWRFQGERSSGDPAPSMPCYGCEEYQRTTMHGLRRATTSGALPSFFRISIRSKTQSLRTTIGAGMALSRSGISSRINGPSTRRPSTKRVVRLVIPIAPTITGRTHLEWGRWPATVLKGNYVAKCRSLRPAPALCYIIPKKFYSDRTSLGLH